MTYYERNLPHWHPATRWIFLTWRLHGSLPLDVIVKIKQSKVDAGHRFAHTERYLDEVGTGPKWLADPCIAEIVVNCIREGAGTLNFYELYSFAVMPNHVHLLLNPAVPLKRITRGIKGVSAREANRILRRNGQPFWQAESFDHWVRGGSQAEKLRRYIEQNPVKAGLVRCPEDWPWSSASRRS